MRAYADVLKYFLKKQGISPAELARRMGTSRSSICELTSGRSKEPTLGKAKAIADALGVTLDDMASMVYEDKEV
jgi:transcriptional regulator with XRE-family HTH domain